jgi:hypothetical protein
MKPEKLHAADYTASEVEAAKRVMIEVAQNLGEYADACVVVGGWVPELLLPEAEPKHTGAETFDLASSAAAELTGLERPSKIWTCK